jgi:thiamine biosynthesis lipoprotein
MLQRFSFPFSAMASDCAIHMYADDQVEAEAVATAAITEVARIEQRYSRYRSNSILAEINEVAQRSGSIAVDDETAKLLDYAHACYRRSEGLFDITSGILRKSWNFKSGRLPDRKAIDELLPRIGLSKVYWERPKLTFPIAGMELDFGGIGKEYAADQAAAVCSALGARHGLIDHGALASSGDYERYMMVDGKRYCHILNPVTGWPTHGLVAVSVIADQCLVAGTIATVAMLKGRDGISWLSGLGLKHFFMDENGVCGGNMLAPAPHPNQDRCSPI